ncbi:MAG TPA: exopolysaccharide biosynthesis polyprenyl glycosylphosphotransferase [Verrucomicrobiae bacterium]|nr:exopolysaccharide biosynthesis polyprenyl glycosylphosphotransferase [Verrucomicrobiae bacterium]
MTHSPLAQHLRHALDGKAGDLLPLCDFASLLVAGYLSVLACAIAAAAAGAPPESWADVRQVTWVAALIAPFVLYDSRFAAIAARPEAIAVAYARRMLAFLGLTGVIALAGRWLESAPPGWLAAWLGGTVLLTAGSRLLLAAALRRFEPGVRPLATAVPTFERVGPLAVTVISERPIRRWSAVTKSGADLALAIVITVLLLPVLGLIALAIRLDSPGPILFTQRRHGFNNSTFDIYKFRTMRVAPLAAGAGLQQTVRGDPRVTRVGRFLRKWSLDELPQVLNVLEGSMALVGPRPHAVDMRTEQRLGHEITDTYPHRHRVKPGITGWSQVNGCRGATDTTAQLRQRVELDLYYIEHWSPLLDLKILTRTFREVLRATNAF